VTTRRITAYWGVLAAAALTTLVAATVAAALAVFAAQALPLAARHDLAVAQDTSLAMSGPASRDEVSPDGARLRAMIATALPGIPLSFYQAAWSDQLGLVPGALPARPRSAGHSDIPILEAAAFGGIQRHAVLVAGAWPAPPRAGQQATGQAVTGPPVPAALPAASAALLRVSVGDVLRLTDRVTNTTTAFRLTGLFVPRPQAVTAAASTAPGGTAAASTADDFWKVNTIPAAGYRVLGGFATYGPLVVDPSALGLPASAGGTTGGTASTTGGTASTTGGTAGTAGTTALQVYQGSWVVRPDLDRLPAGDYGAMAARLSALQQSLATSSTLGGMALTTALPDVLRGTASELTVARSLLVISALQLLLLTAAALLATARLLVSQREGETALLSARGATRAQLTRMTAAEVIPLAVAAAAAGGLAGTWLADVLARSGPLRGAGLRLPGLPDGGTLAGALIAAVAVALCAAGALLAPALTQGSARPGVALTRRGRQATVAGATRAGADLALIGLAVAAGWELRRYSAVSDIAGGTAGIDPVLALAPALALAGGTVITLRLLPLAARVTDRLAARGKSLTPAMAGWQFSRQPLRSGGAALLIVMAVATGTLALAQHASWTRSVADQSAFTAGAAARVDLATPLTPGQAGALTSQGAMAVSVQPQASPPVLALDASRAASVTLLRGDQAPSPATLFGKITPARVPGTVLGGKPATVRLTATLTAPSLLLSPGGATPRTPRGMPDEKARISSMLSPGATTPRTPRGAPNGKATIPVTRNAARVPPSITLTGPSQPAVTFAILDASGASYQLNAGTLPPDGHPHALSASLGGARASYPLRLIAISVTYPMPAAAAGKATLTVDGPSLRGWNASLTSADLANLAGGTGTLAGSSPPAGTSWQDTAASGVARLSFQTGYGRAAPSQANPRAALQPLDGQVTLTDVPAPLAPIPAIATQAYLDSAPARVGSTVTVTVAGVEVPVTIVASVSAFPAIAPASGGTLIVDLSAAGEHLAAAGAQPLPVTEWWLSAPPTAVPAGAVVTTAAALRAHLVAEPLAAAPQQALLALAAAAALLAITGFCVSIATGVRARRQENALLAALGVTARTAAAQLCLEKFLLSGISAVLGLVLGAVVAQLLVPAVTLTADATRPVPSPLTMLALPQAVTLAVVVAVLPVLVAAVAMIRRPDPAAELRASQA
jgi:ABC-type antimicrobial peptide transport system permease subunit